MDTAYGPIHVGSDSEVFVNSASELISDITSASCRVPTWKLISDGDLWEHFYNAVVAKNPKAVKVTWVKGHATEEHVANGITTRRNKEGNEKADETADLGSDLHGKDLNKLATKYNKRHFFYTRFMIQISKHIIEAYLMHRSLTRIKDDQMAQDIGITKKVSFNPLWYINVES